MFRDTIQKTIDRIDGIGGAAGILMGFDGIAVDSYVRPGSADVSTIAAELTHIVAEIRRTMGGAGNGVLAEMTVRTDKLAVLIQLVTKDYFLVLGVPADGKLGKVRYLLRLLAPQIRAEL